MPIRNKQLNKLGYVTKETYHHRPEGSTVFAASRGRTNRSKSSFWASGQHWLVSLVGNEQIMSK
jgi:hypothetical protein